MDKQVTKYNSKTLNALLGRGVELHLAEALINKGYNLGKLKLLSKNDLKGLGLTNEVIQILNNEDRPPIPHETVIKLLYESKSTCCVCRDSSKGVIIHHIVEWHISKSHDESNLVVLCPNHHDEAHTKRELSLELSPKRLIGIKEKWITAVEHQDAKTILGLIGEWSRWDYINQNRAFEYFLNLKINPSKFETYKILRAHSIINDIGLINPIKQWDVDHPPKYYFTDIGSLQIYLTYYLKQVVEEIVKRIPLIDITNNMNKSDIKALVKPGVFISAQLGFYFKEEAKYEDYKSQRKTAYYKGNKIKIQFSFDAWECTSNSGRFDHMTSKKIITPVLFVTSVLEDNGWLNISASCLAAGSYFDEHCISRFSNEE